MRGVRRYLLASRLPQDQTPSSLGEFNSIVHDCQAYSWLGRSTSWRAAPETGEGTAWLLSLGRYA